MPTKKTKKKNTHSFPKKKTMVIPVINFALDFKVYDINLGILLPAEKKGTAYEYSTYSFDHEKFNKIASNFRDYSRKNFGQALNLEIFLQGSLQTSTVAFFEVAKSDLKDEHPFEITAVDRARVSAIPCPVTNIWKAMGVSVHEKSLDIISCISEEQDEHTAFIGNTLKGDVFLVRENHKNTIWNLPGKIRVLGTPSGSTSHPHGIGANGQFYVFSEGTWRKKKELNFNLSLLSQTIQMYFWNKDFFWFLDGKGHVLVATPGVSKGKDISEDKNTLQILPLLDSSDRTFVPVFRVTSDLKIEFRTEVSIKNPTGRSWVSVKSSNISHIAAGYYLEQNKEGEADKKTLVLFALNPKTKRIYFTRFPGGDKPAVAWKQLPTLPTTTRKTQPKPVAIFANKDKLFVFSENRSCFCWVYNKHDDSSSSSCWVDTGIVLPKSTKSCSVFI